MRLDTLGLISTLGGLILTPISIQTNLYGLYYFNVLSLTPK